MNEIDREAILQNLVDCFDYLRDVFIAELRGESIPSEIIESLNLLQAGLVKLGGEIVLPIQQKYVQSGDHALVEILNEINDPDSLDFYIETYKQTDFMAGMSCLIGIRRLKLLKGYQFVNSVLLDHLNGVRNGLPRNTTEVVTICDILGDWGDNQALETLKVATNIHAEPQMPRVAIETLAKFPEAHTFLQVLAEKDQSLHSMIYEALREK
jgi:hypothetical protein